MNNKIYAFMLCCALLAGTGNAKAQYLQFFPDMVNYINADVMIDTGGTTFRILHQDSTLQLFRTLIHADNNGTPQWALSATNYGRHTLMADGSMISTGGVRQSNGNNMALVQKNDKTGSIVWTKTAKASSDMSFNNLLVNDSDVIYLPLVASGFLGSTYYSKAGVMALDQKGDRLWTRYFSIGTLTVDFSFSRSMVAANGDFIGVADVRGSMNKQYTGMMVTRINQQGVTVFSRYIDFLQTHTQSSVTALAETAGGDIVIGGRLMTDQISTSTNTMWVARLSGAGVMQVQKTYHAGEPAGEQLHSIKYHNNKLYAYLHIYSPADTPKAAFWVGEIDEQTLAVTNHTALNRYPVPEDPYGNVADAFCITKDGKPTFIGGIYCEGRGKYMPLIAQFAPTTLRSSCDTMQRTKTLIDSVATYKDTAFVSSATFTITMGTDTNKITFTPIAVPRTGDLCLGCDSARNNPPSVVITTVAASSALTVFPNPGTGIFTIEYTAVTNDAKIMLYNAMGKLVSTSKLSRGATTADISSQPTGVYYLRVIDGQNVQSMKLIKQ